MNNEERDNILDRLEQVLINSRLGTEEQVAVVMLLAFNLLAASRANAVSLALSDGRTLSVKLENPNGTPLLTH
ncbi:hypothetical protein CYR32_07410 [Chimaeribacter coloradensis]|uniref:Uncharacterized protein n=1 Tax=Chimaeribacter coloradensis TaxID=2060068 RepID=A0A2N5E838_9GAMM|nr:hypothetical protein [Chimaeribacter coloradensis]PLR37626.1 hypothetical protein CYR32_07410 [Chimaeribacter coloradensis]